MQKTYEVGKTYKNKRGNSVKIIHILPIRVKYCVIGVVDNKKIEEYTPAGKYDPDIECTFDLEELTVPFTRGQTIYSLHKPFTMIVTECTGIESVVFEGVVTASAHNNYRVGEHARNWAIDRFTSDPNLAYSNKEWPINPCR